MPNRPIREGMIAGIIGATSVAVWFFIVDMIAGQPLATPNALGQALMSVLGPGNDSMTTHVIFYTVFHYAAFILLGVVVVGMLKLSERHHWFLGGMMIFFVMFELGFYGLVALFERSTTLGHIAWYQIGAANLVAAVMMGLYLRRAYPHAGEQLREVLAGGE